MKATIVLSFLSALFVYNYYKNERTHTISITKTGYNYPLLQGIADLYPNDNGIEKDTNVLFTEMFNLTLPEICSHYTDVKNREGMSLLNDVPKGSNARSLKITNKGGVNDGGHLFKMFSPGFDSVIYIRYYVKYPLQSKGYIHHEAIRTGGHNPPSPFHIGTAGLCGMGDKRFSVSYEPIDEPAMDAYVYWADMKSWNGGTSCYGNDFVNGSATAQQLTWNEWICVELMVKLNNPVTAYNGELRIWQDGKEVGYWGAGFPNGHWETDSWFNNAADPPFEGFRWRTDEKLNINYLWIEFYDDKSPVGDSHYIQYSNVVVAKEYIGPIKK